MVVDLGGTRFRVALVSAAGVIVRRVASPTLADRGREDVLRRLVAAVLDLVASIPREQIRGLGLGVPGPVDPVAGVVHSMPNLPGWGGSPIKAILEGQLGFRVAIGNDANLPALGEHRFGAGRGVDDLIYVTVSTGIGGGIIAAGKLLLGAHGLAGEIGHMLVERGGARCGCGNAGCLEAMASGPAIARSAVRRIEAGERSLIDDLVDGDLGRVTAETVVSAALEKDSLANEAIVEAARTLGAALASLVHLLDPRLIVIGGGVSNARDLLFRPLRQRLEEGLMPGFRGGVQVVPAALGDDAGLMGAVALVSDQVSAR